MARFRVLALCSSSLLLVASCRTIPSPEGRQDPREGTGGVDGAGVGADSGPHTGGGEASTGGVQSASGAGAQSAPGGAGQSQQFAIAGQGGSGIDGGASGGSVPAGAGAGFGPGGSGGYAGAAAHVEAGGVGGAAGSSSVDSAGAGGVCNDSVCASECRKVVSISCGAKHTCALLDCGHVRCWGSNSYGQLGPGNPYAPDDETRSSIGDDEPASASVLVPLPGLALSVRAGRDHACALLEDGSVYCWGRNNDAQLGIGELRDDGEPPSDDLLPVSLDEPAVSLTVGSDHACVLTKYKSLRCWGRGRDGALGYGSTVSVGSDPENVPAELAPVAAGSVRSVEAGRAHTCAMMDDATVRCWGHNLYGQLGLGNTEEFGDEAGEDPADLEAIPLAGFVSALAPGSAFHVCVVLQGGEPPGVRGQCWGHNDYRQLGLDTADESLGDDETLVGVEPWVTPDPIQGLAMGESHTCALLTSGKLMCWGRNFEGQLGLASTDTPVSYDPDSAMVELDDVVQVSAGSTHTCALLGNGAVRCWGLSEYGQLGQPRYSEYGGLPGQTPAAMSDVPVIESQEPE